MLFLKKNGCHLPITAVIVVLHRKINLPQFFVEQIYPPSSVADAPASPRGEAFYVTSLVRRISTFFEAQRIRNPKSKIALSNRLPLGGKLARQRLMRGDKSPLSSFGISTPVNPAPLLLIGTFFTAPFTALMHWRWELVCGLFATGGCRAWKPDPGGLVKMTKRKRLFSAGEGGIFL